MLNTNYNRRINKTSTRNNFLEFLKKHKIFATIFIILIIMLVFFIYQLLMVVKVPNIIGKTVKEARNELNEVGLSIKNNNHYAENLIVTYQYPSSHSEMKKGEEITINTNTEEEIEKQQEEERKKQEEDNRVKEIIKEWAEYVRDANEGEVSYKSSRKYDVAEDGKQIYLIIYDTGSEYLEYRQLVAFNEELTNITGTTKLYEFTYISSGSAGANQEKEMLWEAEKLWGIK